METKPNFSELTDGWDVVVIGAGPAGAAASIELAQFGQRVLLIERKSMPRFKVCGCCLNQRSVDLINRFGILERVMDAGAVPLQRFHWVSRRRAADVALPGGVAVSRETLDSLLVDRAAELGVKFVSETSAALGSLVDSGRKVQLKGGGKTRDVTARMVVVAAGLTARAIGDEVESLSVAEGSYLGVGRMTHDVSAAYEPGVIYMASGEFGYVGVTRVEGGRLNIAAAMSPQILRDMGPDTACRNLLRDSGLPDVGLPGDKKWDIGGWSGTAPLTWRRAKPSSDRTLFIGDAAGYVEPFTGEGIAWALTAGRLAASFIGKDRWSPSRSREWDAAYERDIRGPQRLCRWMSRLLRHPRLVRQTIGVINLCPWLAQPVVRRIVGRSSK